MARNQPSYDFITGAPSQLPARPGSSAGFRDTLKSSVRVADPLNEELRTRVQTLEYELRTLKEERDLATHQHKQDVVNAERQAQKEFDRAQAADTARRKAEQKAESLVKDASERETRWDNEKAGLERKLRQQIEEARSLREDGEDAKAELADFERSTEHRIKEAEGSAERLQVEAERLRTEASSAVNALSLERQKLAAKEEDVSRLETALLAAKASSSDADISGPLKTQLSEQVVHIRKLEMRERDQAKQIKALQQQQQAVEVIEEQKRALEAKLTMMESLRKELAEAQLRKQSLEDERRAWQSYLESQQEGDTDMELQFESPEAVAKAFVDLRLEVASLTEKLGAVQPDLDIKDESISALQDENAKLSGEVEQLRQQGTTDSTANGAASDAKASARLERQRVLAVKEVEYLRAQLKMFDTEQTEFQPEQFSEAKTQQVKELEDLVDQYRNELQGAQKDLLAAESKVSSNQPPAGTKRKHDNDGEDERLGELKRKYAKLKHEYSKMEVRVTQRDSQLKAKDTEIQALKAPARTRVLELVNNPTTRVEQIKMSTLKSLREENDTLHSLLQKKTASLDSKERLVPAASLESVQAEMEELASALAQEQKLGKRRKDLYAAKAGEFKDAVMALVGWKVNFLPNGRVKVASIFNNDEDMEERGEENSIEFNVEKETMKVSGGLDSEFAKDIRSMIEFWVEGKKEIPCFLAAMTLDFYERRMQSAK